jgi:two-component system CheB/CheR fusion protein
VDNSELEVLTNQAIHDRYAVDGVVVNREMRIMLFRGHTGSYLDPAPGNPSFNLLRMVREELAFKLESMVSRAIEQNVPIRASGIRIERSGDSREIEIEVVPLRSQRYSESYYFVLFTDVSQPVQRGLQSEESAAGHETDVDQRTVRLQRELARARAHLRRMAEEHEGNVEELRATNEEVRSTNEELQSTNEELATAKEELQSANEELTTINEELQTKNADLGSLNNDLKNLFVAVNLPIVIVDNEYRLRRFTPAAENFLNLLSSDIGRVVTNLRGTLEIPNLKELLRRAIEELNVSVFEIEAANNRWSSVTIRPYRTTDHRIDGAVIAFNDIDSLKRSLDEAQDARDYAEGIVETIWEPLIVLDKELRVQRAAPRFYQTFQVTPEDTEGRLLFDVGSRQWDIPQLRSQLEEVVARNSSFQNFEVQRMFPNIGYRSMRLNARRIRQKRANMETVLLAIEDVTERQEAAEIRYRRLFETAKDGILVLNADDGQILDVNPFFVDLCKCTRDELMGKQIWETGLFDLTPEMRDLLSESQQRETVRYDGIRLNARDGKRIETEMICNRYAVAGERIIQCNIRDITDRSRAEADLRRSNEDLQQFAYAASHDLQEPLRMVGSYAQLLEKKYESLVDQEGRDFLQYITTGVERMSHLIKDLLVYSQTSTRDTRPEAVNAETVLAWTVMNLQMAISDSNAIITNDPLPTVSIDQMHFIQVFQNLIGNSLKYRKPNEIPRIHISAEHQGTEWVFTFRDNGLGFDTRYSKHIFGVFKRLHGRQYPGTGIGLSICKKIIERHGGRMWVESSPGDGATFYFTVPEVK